MVSDYLETLSSLIAWRPSAALGQTCSRAIAAFSIIQYTFFVDMPTRLLPCFFFSQILQLCLDVILKAIADKVNK